MRCVVQDGETQPIASGTTGTQSYGRSFVCLLVVVGSPVRKRQRNLAESVSFCRSDEMKEVVGTDGKIYTMVRISSCEIVAYHQMMKTGDLSSVCLINPLSLECLSLNS